MPYSFKELMRSIAGIIMPSGYDSVKDRGRKRLFVLFLFLIMLPLVAFGFLQLMHGEYTFGIVDFAAAAVLLGFIILYRRVKNGIMAHRFVIILMMCLFVYWIKTGAVNGYASLWVLAFPLFSFFLTGRREGLIWTGMMLAATVLLFVNPFSFFDVWSYPSDYVIRLLIAFVVILFFTFIYESISEKFTEAIESESRLILKEKEQLAAAMNEVEAVNVRLREEMEVRRIAEEELRKHRDNLEDLVIERTRELWRYNRELEKSEKRYRLLADNITDMIWHLDFNLRLQYVSPSVYDLFGYTVEEAVTLPLEATHTPESIEKIKRTFEEQLAIDGNEGVDPKRFVVVQLRQRRKDGTLFDTEIKASFMRDESGRPVGIVGVSRDISARVRVQQEKEKIQEQLAHAQKMEAVGTLAGGLAHDFNNILSGILGSFDLLGLLLKMENLSEREKIEKYLAVGIESTKRSVDIIRNLLALSSRHELRLGPVDINDAVSQTLELCKNSFPKSVVLDFKYSPDKPIVMGDMAQIGQVLLNLCINASHAMTIMRGPDERQGGVLSVEVDITGADSIVGGAGGGLTDGSRRWVRIVVSDSGVGMDSETIERIFEPFFSRKERDKGSGLGLAMTYNIIQNHHGIIRVDSERGKGSRFTIYFPLSEESREREGVPAQRGGLVTGTGKILVIDDERLVLNVTKGFLEQCGYDVITANTPETGVDVFRERHADLSGVIIDLSMQGMNGLDVFVKLKKIDPGVKAILSSGMLDAESRERARVLGFRDFVNKPFQARELSIVVNNVLKG